MGTPDFAVPALESLCRDHDVVAVYTQPDRAVGRGLELRAPVVKQVAQRLAVPEIRQPEKLSQPGEFEHLQSLNPDVIVVVAYGQILRQNVIDLPRLGCINIHSSLLPRWRGAAPIHWALLAGDVESGVTTMRIVQKLDAGAILLQESTPIGPRETGQSLHDRLAQIGGRLITTTLSGLIQGTLEAQPQDEAQVTLASKLDKEMEQLDPQLGAAVLDRRIRALNPWPGTSIWVAQTGDRIKIKEARPYLDVQGPAVPVHPTESGPRGWLFDRAGMLFLSTQAGSLELVRLQQDGKKEGDAAAFLNGLRGRGQSLPIEVSFSPPCKEK